MSVCQNELRALSMMARLNKDTVVVPSSSYLATLLVGHAQLHSSSHLFCVDHRRTFHSLHMNYSISSFSSAAASH